MKVLYIAHFSEDSNWSVSAIHKVLALLSNEVDVVCRNVKLNNQSNVNLPPQIQDCLKKDLNNVDICIQHVLPNLIVGSKKFKKNIACVHLDTQINSEHCWINGLNLVDEVWVNNKDSLSNLLDLDINAKYIPSCFYLDAYKSDYDLLDLGEMNNKFKFYTVASMGEKSNLNSIIRSYFSSCNISYNVCFVFNIYDNSGNDENIKNYFSDYIKRNKEIMRVNTNEIYFPPVFLISRHLNPMELQSLHKTCDCYVELSRSADFSIPAFEAMCHGSTPICSNNGSYKDFITEDKNSGTLINGIKNVCFDPNPPSPFLFTSKELWFISDEQKTKQAMNWYYKNKTSIDKSVGLKNAQEFDYKKVAEKMKESFNE